MDAIFFFATACIFALTYAYYNGANDCANTIATAIKTDALSYKQAVILAGILNFIGPFITSAVAKTLAKGIVTPEEITKMVILGGLAGAVLWSWFATNGIPDFLIRKIETRIKEEGTAKKIRRALEGGIPVSITHSLVGGIAGAGIAHGGISILVWDVLFWKIIVGIALAPLLGFIAGYIILVLLKWAMFPFKMTLSTANRNWRWGQILSSSWLSLSHGMNDGQNAVGIIALAYFAAGFSTDITISWWMIAVSGLAIALGTMISGWRVIRTTGWEIVELEPIDGFAAQMASAVVLTVKSFYGMPVSTTHVAISGILGVGGAKALNKVEWGVTRHIVMAWIITIPAAGFTGAITYLLLKEILNMFF